MIPARFEDVAFGFVLSGLMSFVVSGISTYLATGLVDGFLGIWITGWLPSWLVSFPTVLVVAPIARGLVRKFTIPE